MQPTRNNVTINSQSSYRATTKVEKVDIFITIFYYFIVFKKGAGRKAVLRPKLASPVWKRYEP
jgi:hypothetical protein